MPNRPAPISDLARMYRERIPTAPKSIGRLGPVSIGGGGLSLNPMPALRSAGGFFKRAVESLDPRLLAEQGGRSVEHVYGDARELVKSVVTGEDTLSQSPSARAYQAAGGGLAGTLNAALPYVDVATAIVPTTKVFTPAGRVALAADAAERVASRQLGQAISRATPAVRQATADATERLAQSMAAREAGIPASALSDRPTISMRPTTPRSTNVDALQRFIDEKRATELPPPSQFATPEPTLSQRDMDLLRYNPAGDTPTADQLARNLEAMSKNRNPVTTQVDWATTDPSRDVDLTRVFRNEFDAQIVSPEAASVWAAQTAAKQGVNDFLVRNGLQSQLISNAPSYVNLRTLPNYIATLDWSALMKAVPELRNYYVDVMRSYGIGM